MRAMSQLFNSVMIEKGKLTNLSESNAPKKSTSREASASSRNSDLSSRRTTSRISLHSRGDDRHNPDSEEFAPFRRKAIPRGSEEDDEDVEEDEHDEEAPANDGDEHEKAHEWMNGDEGEKTREQRTRADYYEDEEPVPSRQAARKRRGRLDKHQRLTSTSEGRRPQGHQSTPIPAAAFILRADILQDYNSFPPTAEESLTTFEAKVMDMAARCRGTESLEEVNPAMVSELFRAETSRWRAISMLHLRLVWEAVKRFVHLALEHCADPSLLHDLKRFIVNDRLDKLHYKAEQKLVELLSCHEGMNPAFYDFLGKLDDNMSNVQTKARTPMQDLSRDILNQINANLTTRTMENICDMVLQAAGCSLSLKSRKARLLMNKVQDALVNSTSEDDPEKNLARYNEDSEKIAVQRAIATLQKYYEAR